MHSVASQVAYRTHTFLHCHDEHNEGGWLIQPPHGKLSPIFRFEEPHAQSAPYRARPASVWMVRAIRCKRMKPEDLQRLVTVAMPYGKYQGRLIADLPGAYLAWFARKGFPPGDLGNLLALMLELDHNGLRSLLDPLRKR